MVHICTCQAMFCTRSVWLVLREFKILWIFVLNMPNCMLFSHNMRWIVTSTHVLQATKVHIQCKCRYCNLWTYSGLNIHKSTCYFHLVEDYLKRRINLDHIHSHCCFHLLRYQLQRARDDLIHSLSAGFDRSLEDARVVLGLPNRYSL